MKKTNSRPVWLAGLITMTLLATLPAQAANLLINGDFEASSNMFTTPPGWTNIGPATGVVPYLAANQVPFDGLNFYTLGGPGTNGISSIGVGITQTVATVTSNTYRLTFGYSGENGPNLETILGVSIGGVVTPITITADSSGFFQRPFTVVQLDYVATGPSTAISFTLLGTNEVGLIGNNDPLIDRVVFEQIAVGNPSAVPEPSSLALVAAGMVAFGVTRWRRRQA